MDVLTAPVANLRTTWNQFSSKSLLDSLPPSLPVTPCVLGSHNSTQIPLSNSFYFSIFFIFGGGLYFLLLLPFTLRQKQVLAAPLATGLFFAPLIFTSDSPMLQLVHMGACGCVLMRMIDLYYVTPWRIGKEPTLNLEDWWTEIWKPFRKVPMTKEQLQRYELESHQSRLRREQEKRELEQFKAEKAKAKLKAKTLSEDSQNEHNTNGTASNDTNNNTNNDDNDTSSSGSGSGSSTPTLRQRHAKTTTTETTETPTAHNKGKPIRQIFVPPTDKNPQHWSTYLPRWIFYAVLMDIVPFVLSFLTFEQINSFSLPGQFLVTVAVGSLVIFDISLANYSIMFIWAAVTGNLIHDTEWTLVRHYFPGVATSPAEFWRQWHHLFQYIWVDLGFKPTHHLLRKHVTNKTANRELARTVEMVLPIMGVFLMSGLMHEYMMVGMFHARVGHMTAFFLIQGAATIVSKALYNTIGQKVHVPPVILIALTWAFNLSTAALFMEPVMQYEGFNIIAKQSMLIRGYNLLRSHGVF